MFLFFKKIIFTLPLFLTSCGGEKELSSQSAFQSPIFALTAEVTYQDQKFPAQGIAGIYPSSGYLTCEQAQIQTGFFVWFHHRIAYPVEKVSSQIRLSKNIFQSFNYNDYTYSHPVVHEHSEGFPLSSLYNFQYFGPIFELSRDEHLLIYRANVEAGNMGKLQMQFNEILKETTPKTPILQNRILLPSIHFEDGTTTECTQWSTSSEKSRCIDHKPACGLPTAIDIIYISHQKKSNVTLKDLGINQDSHGRQVGIVLFEIVGSPSDQNRVVIENVTLTETLANGQIKTMKGTPYETHGSHLYDFGRGPYQPNAIYIITVHDAYIYHSNQRISIGSPHSVQFTTAPADLFYK